MRLNGVACFFTLTGILIACNIYTFIPIYEDIAQEFHISTGKAVYGSSFFTFLYAVGLLTFGTVSDKVGRKKVLVIGLFLSAVTTLLVALSFNEWSIYI
jgi:MFS transporter, YNFM family, putative membrane transport protein